MASKDLFPEAMESFVSTYPVKRECEESNVDFHISEYDSSQGTSPLSITVASRHSYVSLSPDWVRSIPGTNDVEIKCNPSLKKSCNEASRDPIIAPKSNLVQIPAEEVSLTSPKAVKVASVKPTSWLDDLLSKIQTKSEPFVLKQAVEAIPVRNVSIGPISEPYVQFSRKYSLLPAPLPAECKVSLKKNIFYIPADATVETPNMMTCMINETCKTVNSSIYDPFCEISDIKLSKKTWRGSIRFRGVPLWVRRQMTVALQEVEIPISTGFAS